MKSWSARRFAFVNIVTTSVRNQPSGTHNCNHNPGSVYSGSAGFAPLSTFGSSTGRLTSVSTRGMMSRRNACFRESFASDTSSTLTPATIFPIVWPNLACRAMLYAMNTNEYARNQATRRAVGVEPPYIRELMNDSGQKTAPSTIPASTLCQNVRYFNSTTSRLTLHTKVSSAVYLLSIWKYFREKTRYPWQIHGTVGRRG